VNLLLWTGSAVVENNLFHGNVNFGGDICIEIHNLTSSSGCISVDDSRCRKLIGQKLRNLYVILDLFCMQ